MMRPRPLALIAFVLFATVPLPAAAFPWMVRHGYSTCAQCHADPSGAGVLTAYGRAQSEVVVRTPWGARGEEWEPGRAAKPFFGVVELPPAIDLGFSSRSAQLVVEPEEGEEDSRFLQMQTDLRGAFRAGKVQGYLSLAGSRSRRTAPARVTKNDGDEATNLLSREHWLGYAPGDAWLVRGGRMILPFGVRQPEHYLWVREATRTDIDSTGQHGIAVGWTGDALRAEVMGVAGNYQLSPDRFRERGYAGFAEWAISPSNVVGVSSEVLHAEADVAFRRPLTRQAHGVMARLSPLEPLVVLAEGDLLRTDLEGTRAVNGFVSMLQADVEPIQGLHLLGTGELYRPDLDGDDWLGAWLSVVWYFAPHVDLRADAVRRSIPTGDARTRVDLFLFQLHFFL